MLEEILVATAIGVAVLWVIFTVAVILAALAVAFLLCRNIECPVCGGERCLPSHVPLNEVCCACGHEFTPCMHKPYTPDR